MKIQKCRNKPGLAQPVACAYLPHTFLTSSTSEHWEYHKSLTFPSSHVQAAPVMEKNFAQIRPRFPCAFLTPLVYVTVLSPPLCSAAVSRSYKRD